MDATILYKSVLKEYGINLSTVKFEKIESVLDILNNQFSRNENALKAIFDNTNFTLLDISDNVEAMSGYTKEEIYSKNILPFFDSIDVQHAQFPVEVVRWYTYLFGMLPPNTNHIGLKSCICGVKVKRKDGKKLRILLRFVPLEIDENGLPKMSIITLDDISHLLKGDFYWFRADYNQTPLNQHHWILNDLKIPKNDIISEREKDVLRLIAEGYESKEIGEKLFISTSTVDNHRRNMIGRTGARDTTALIQICKMVEII
jgi:DNA-binding CsgD family transcriptional regulator